MNSAGTIAFNNTKSGVLTAPVAIKTLQGVLNVNNMGTINGVITTTGGKTNVDNSGLWNNTGPSVITTLINTGVINMLNQVTVTGRAKIAGAIVSSVNLGAGAIAARAKVFSAGAVVGNATVFINPVGPKTFVATPILVAQASSGTFTLGNPDALSQAGFVDFGFRQFAPGKFGVVAALDAAGVGALSGSVAGAITAINSGFFRDADAFLASPAGAGANQWCGGPFVRTSAGHIAQSATATTAPAPGFSGAAGAKTNTGYAGYQVGADIGLCNINGGGVNAHVGVTGGQVFANGSDGNGGVTHLKFTIPYFGVYGAVTAGGFLAMLQVRHDAYDMNVTNSPAGLNAAPLHGRGTAIDGTLRYRFDLADHWKVEPSVALSHERLNVDALAVAPGVLSFGAFTSTLGRAGLRVGKSIEYGGVAIEPYAQANIWHEFAGNLGQTYSVNGFNIPVSLSRVGTFAEFGVGAAVQAPGGWMGFAQADLRTGAKLKAYSGTIAIRKQF